MVKRRKRLQHLKAVEFRQTGVQDKQVKPLPREQLQSLRTVWRDQRVKAPYLRARRDPAGRALAEHSNQKPHERTSCV